MQRVSAEDLSVRCHNCNWKGKLPQLQMRVSGDLSVCSTVCPNCKLHSFLDYNIKWWRKVLSRL